MSTQSRPDLSLETTERLIQRFGARCSLLRYVEDLVPDLRAHLRDVDCLALYLSLLRCPVRKARQDVLCMQFVQCGDYGQFVNLTK